MLQPLKNIKNSRLAYEIYPQFRAKFPSFANLYKIRSKLKMEMYNYFSDKGFINIDTPILTRYIRDASEDVLYIETSNILKNECPVDLTFGHPVYLSPSGQLPLQCFISGISKVYSFGTAFYNGDSSGKHLIEYQKVICEEAFLNGSAGLENVIARVELFLKFLMQRMLETCYDELEFFHTQLLERLEKVVYASFPRITYSDAVEVLKNHQEEVHNPVKYGMNICRTGEKVLTDYFEGNPYFITDYPFDMKPFYAANNDNSNSVKAFSLILPLSSIVASGVIADHDYSEISKKLELFGGKDYYSWWLKAQEWGCPPSGGFSFGIDRLIYFMLKDSQIRHIAPFPRAQNHCKL